MADNDNLEADANCARAKGQALAVASSSLAGPLSKMSGSNLVDHQGVIDFDAPTSQLVKRSAADSRAQSWPISATVMKRSCAKIVVDGVRTGDSYATLADEFRQSQNHTVLGTCKKAVR